MSLFQESFKVLNDHQSVRLFNIILGASQFFGISAILLVAIWMAGFDGGFTTGLQFHYHPTFMVMGMIFLAGDGILVYRVFRYERKRFSKLLHLTLHTMVLIFAVVALKAVFDSHNNHKNDKDEPDPLPNMYSLHSWVGLTSVIAFFIQYLFGFTIFFFPGWHIPMRHFMLPYHQVFGLIILCFLAITAVMGISEQAAWHHKCWTVDHILCSQQSFSTLLGISILMFATCILIIVLNPRWRRQPLPEEETLHRLNNID
uniref:Cytochrome b561 domain-containing protein n=1 Tax=Elaeophora elaphi TaxID=1147741 RepID=A0A0R3RKF3_9BILA